MHDPAWPDKIMSAALLVTIGGALALVFVGLRLTDATIEAESAPILQDWPTAIMVPAGVVAIAVGIFGYFHQAWGLVSVGIVANIASLGFLGVSAVLGVVAIVPLVRAFVEREEVKLDHRRVHAHQWPDKAMMAGTLLSVGASTALVAGVLMFLDTADRVVSAPLWGAGLLAASILAFVAARQAYRTRHVWLAWLAVLALVGTAAFYVVGPVMGVAAGVYLLMADRELEFASAGAAPRS